MQSKSSLGAGFNELSILYVEVHEARLARRAAALASPAEFAAANARVARAFEAVRVASPLPRRAA